VGFSELLATVDRAVRKTLGGSVTYSPTSGSPVTVDGVFDAAYVRVDLGQAGVSSSGPAVFLRLSDLPSDPSTDATATVTVSGVTYTVHEAQPDGLGGVLLQLHQV
jgi:hypothetical protein